MKNALMRWLLALALLLTVAPAFAQQPQTDAATAAVAWMRTQQLADGGFEGFGTGSTADAIYALAAAGVNVDSVAGAGANPHQYVEAKIADISTTPGLAAKYVIAELLSGHDPRAVAGTDLVAAVKASYHTDTGVYGDDVTTHALALVALVAAGETLPVPAVEALAALQLADGSWSFTGDPTPGAGDTNTTAVAVQALVAAGQGGSPAVTRGMAYLQTQRNPDGGFPYSQNSQFGTDSDANSTALVIQAIVATGGNPTAAPWADATGNPLQALLSLQNASGAFAYQAAFPDDNTLATYQAIPAILLQTLPLKAVVVNPAPAPTATPVPPTVPGQLPDTSGSSLPWLALLGAGVGLVAAGARLRRRAA